jgi:ATP-dependent Clp protease ATP-binding subunit ClpB
MTDATYKAIEKASTLARDNGHSVCDPVHLCAVLFHDEDSIGARVCSRAEGGPDVTVIRRNLQKIILKKPSQTPAPMEAPPSTALQQLLQRAKKAAKANGDSLVSLDHLLMCQYDERDVSKVLEESGLTKKMARAAVDDLRGGRKVTTASAEDTYEALSKYGVDLIQMAEEGKLDPVIGRDTEIRRVIQILARRTKNNRKC